MFWILHAAKGIADEAVLILDETTLQEGDIDLPVTLEKLDRAFLGGGWKAETLIEATELTGHLGRLPLGNLMVRQW